MYHHNYHTRQQTSAAIMAQQWGKNRLAKHLVKLGADPSQEDEFVGEG